MLVNTLAYLGGNATAGGNVDVESLSNEIVNSAVGTYTVSLIVIDLAGSGSVYSLDVTTQAYVDSGAVVHAGGSVNIAADDRTQTDLDADSISVGGVAGAGASLAVGWIDKTVEAFVAGPDAARSLGAARVTAEGNLPPITANTGDFVIGYDSNEDAADPGGIHSPLGGLASAIDTIVNNPVGQLVGALLETIFGIATTVRVPPLDPSLTSQRTAAPQTDLFRGVAITATSRDDIETLARGLAGSTGDPFLGLSVSPELSGSAALITNQVSAFVAGGATVNTPHDVRVAAGSDAYHMGVAGSAAVAATAPVGAAVNVSLLNITTQAYVQGQVGNVTPVEDLQIVAFSIEHVLAVAGGVAATTGEFGVSLNASLPVISVETHTHAFVDTGGFVHAVGNVLVKAHDDTGTTTVGGNAMLNGSVGDSFGATASVTIVGKDTRAWVAGGSTVLADGLTGTTITVADGFPAFDFDSSADVNAGADTIDLHNDTLQTGDPVLYYNLGGDNVGNLKDGKTYYVRVVSPGCLQAVHRPDGRDQRHPIG